MEISAVNEVFQEVFRGIIIGAGTVSGVTTREDFPAVWVKFRIPNGRRKVRVWLKAFKQPSPFHTGWTVPCEFIIYTGNVYTAGEIFEQKNVNDSKELRDHLTYIKKHLVSELNKKMG